VDQQQRLAFVVAVHGAAQHLVALHQGLQRLVQAFDLQRAGQAQGQGHAIGTAALAELLGDPQPALGQ